MSHPHNCMKCGQGLTCFEEENGCQPGHEVTCDDCVAEAFRAEGKRSLETTLPSVALTPEMVKSLRAAGKNVEKWTDERNRLIREAVAAGGTLREVGEATGLSHTAVKLICERS